MNCRRAKKLIFEFVDGLTDEKARLDLERYLGECTECDRLASQLTQSLDLIHRMPQEELDENFNWKVRLGIHKERNAIQERAASQGSLFRAWNFRYAASAVSGFAVILVVGWIAINAGLTSVPVSAPLETRLMSQAPGLASDADEPAAAGKEIAQSDPVIAQDQMAEEEVAREEKAAAPSPLKKESINRPRSILPSMAASPSGLVTDGAMQVPGEAGRTGGAIDLENTAELDSLVHQETRGLSEEQRVLYFQKRIQKLHDHLEKCKHAERK